MEPQQQAPMAAPMGAPPPMAQPMMQQPPMGAPMGQAPMAQPVMMMQPAPIMVIQQPQMMIAGAGNWVHAMGSIPNVQICCLSTWCPCIRYGQTLDRSGFFPDNKYKNIAYVLLTIYWIIGLQAGMLIPENLQWVPYMLFCLLGFKTRGELRKNYGIHGSDANDCLCWWFCSCCMLCQEAGTVDLKAGFPV